MYQTLDLFKRVAGGVFKYPPSEWMQRWRDRDVKSAKDRSEYLSREAVYSESELLIGGLEIMQDWERPIMKAMAEKVSRDRGHVLEVGFGMGISASYIIEAGASEYTIIEPHPGVLTKIRRDWAPHQPVKVNVVEGFWEDVIAGLGEFDGIFFDTYPVTEDEASNNTLIREFIPYAAKHLRRGGVFTFYGSFPDKLPDEDAALINEHFSEFETFIVEGVKPPKNCQYYGADRMLVPVCIK